LAKGGGGIAAIAADCGGSVGKEHLLGTPARRGKERREERRGMGTSAATTSNLLGIVFRQGGRNCKEAEATAVGGGSGDDSGDSMLVAAATGSAVVVSPAE
jgi:hypothetical protein